MNATVINATWLATTDAPLTYQPTIFIYLVACMICLSVVALLLFGAIRKTNPIYLIASWIRLKCMMCCCKQNPKYTEKVEEDSIALKRLLGGIDNILARE